MQTFLMAVVVISLGIAVMTHFGYKRYSKRRRKSDQRSVEIDPKTKSLFIK